MTEQAYLLIIQGMGVLLMLCISVTAFFLTREFKSKDRFVSALEEVRNAVAALNVTLESMKLWSVEKFVLRTDHAAALETLKADIEMWADKFTKEFENLEKRP